MKLLAFIKAIPDMPPKVGEDYPTSSQLKGVIESASEINLELRCLKNISIYAPSERGAYSTSVILDEYFKVKKDLHSPMALSVTRAHCPPYIDDFPHQLFVSLKDSANHLDGAIVVSPTLRAHMLGRESIEPSAVVYPLDKPFTKYHPQVLNFVAQRAVAYFPMKFAGEK